MLNTMPRDSPWKNNVAKHQRSAACIAAKQTHPSYSPFPETANSPTIYRRNWKETQKHALKDKTGYHSRSIESYHATSIGDDSLVTSYVFRSKFFMYLFWD